MSVLLSRFGPLAALLALALGTSCRAVDVRAYNLDQLHLADGHHHYSAALEGSWEYYFRHVIVPSLTGSKGAATKKDPSRVEDPAESCLELLLELEGLDVSDPYNRARAIQWSSRLAATDTAQLSRERALYVLARAAAPLGKILPSGPAKDRPVSDPDALSSALGSLVAAARPLLGSGEWDATAEADLEAAVGLLRGLNLDLNGAWRSLDVGCGLAARAGWEGRGSGLAKLVADLEKTCVARSLQIGLGDSAPRTQAAAFEVCESIAGHGVLATLLLQSASQQNAPALVVERILTRLKAGGLVLESSEAGAPPPAELREAQLTAIYHIALNREEPELRAAAMSALSRLSGSGISSLREEDWFGWWELRAAALAKGGPKP